MSRTYRRKDKHVRDDWFGWQNNNLVMWDNWFKPDDVWDLMSDDQRKTQHAKYHSDSAYSDTARKCGMKWESNKIRRASARQQLHQATKCEVYEDFDFDSSCDKIIKRLWWDYF